MSELFNINIDAANISKNSNDKKIVYSYILTKAEDSSEKIVEITITTDKKDYIESVKIDMDISDAVYYGFSLINEGRANMDFDTIMQYAKMVTMFYDAIILVCLSDMSVSEAAEKILELDQINQTSEDNESLEINDTLSIALNWEEGHSFTVCCK